jgi:hypothetical protein
MAIQIDCPCGKKLQARDDLLGKRVKCPGCGSVLTVERILDAIPEPPEIDEHSAFEPVGQRSSQSVTSENPSRPTLHDDDDLLDGDERRRRTKPPGNWWSTGPGQVWGGILTIVGAIVWLVVGLALGWIFYYPFILVVVGIITFVKGLIACAQAKPAFVDDDEFDDED